MFKDIPMEGNRKYKKCKLYARYAERKKMMEA